MPEGSEKREGKKTQPPTAWTNPFFMRYLNIEKYNTHYYYCRSDRRLSALNFSQKHANARFIANYLHTNRFPCVDIFFHFFIHFAIGLFRWSIYSILKLNELYDYDILISYSMDIYCIGVIRLAVISPTALTIFLFCHKHTSTHRMPLCGCTV